MRSLVLEETEGVCDTLTVENGYANVFCSITIDEPWQGDTMTGFGAMCTFDLTKEQCIDLIEHLKKRLNAS